MKTKLMFLFALIIGAVSLHAQAATTPTTVFTGSMVKFTVTVDGTAPFGYIWQKAPVGSAAFVTIPGATSGSYTITSATAADAGSYRVLVSNMGGTATSDTATLASGSKPTITSFGLQVIPPPPTT